MSGSDTLLRTYRVLAHAVHVPGRAAAELAGSPMEAACAPADARLVLGRKGLLGKEPATLLALCAVHRMLDLPPGRPTSPAPGAARTAVVVASNLGNAHTVCRVVDDVRDRGVRAVSPLDAPNASSNVIASTIGIWHGFAGPNLAACSGATAGLDALRLAQLLLSCDRADRVAIVGVEVNDPVTERLAGPWLATGAAAVLLGRPAEVPGSQQPSSVTCGPVVRSRDPLPVDPAFAGFYGASGVIELAVAAARLGEEAPGDGALSVICGSPEDGYARVRVDGH